MSGPVPGARCAVCNHADRAAIEQADADGVSRREIARRYGLGKDAVSRHFYGRHAPARPEGEEPELPAPDEMSELDRLRVNRAVLVKELESNPDPGIAREIRQTSERIAALAGEHRATTATVRDVEGLPQLIEAWFRALEPWPEARAAMLEATPEELRP